MFSLSFDLNTRNDKVVFFWCVGVGGRFPLQYFSLVILRLCNDFQFHMNPGSSKKVCGGGLNVILVFFFGPTFFLKT